MQFLFVEVSAGDLSRPLPECSPRARAKDGLSVDIDPIREFGQDLLLRSVQSAVRAQGKVNSRLPFLLTISTSICTTVVAVLYRMSRL